MSYSVAVRNVLWGEPMALCRHCTRRVANKPRGLCKRCYQTPTVRNLYPVNPKYMDRGEPTEAELEAMVEEQMQCLPDWWGLEDPEADDTKPLEE